MYFTTKLWIAPIASMTYFLEPLPRYKNTFTDSKGIINVYTKFISINEKSFTLFTIGLKIKNSVAILRAHRLNSPDGRRHRHLNTVKIIVNKLRRNFKRL